MAKYYYQGWSRFSDLSYRSTRLFLPELLPSSVEPRRSLTRFLNLRWWRSMAFSVLVWVLVIVAYGAGRWLALAWGRTASSMVLQNCTLVWWSCRICLILRVSWCLLKAYRDFLRLVTRWLFAISTLWRRFRRACSSWPRRAAPWYVSCRCSRSRIVSARISWVAIRVSCSLRNLYFSTLFIFYIALALRVWSNSTVCSSSCL